MSLISCGLLLALVGWLTYSRGVGKNGFIKKLKVTKDIKVQRPPRVVVSEKEAVKRMKEFSKRKERFLATARTGKS